MIAEHLHVENSLRQAVKNLTENMMHKLSNTSKHEQKNK